MQSLEGLVPVESGINVEVGSKYVENFQQKLINEPVYGPKLLECLILEA